MRSLIFSSMILLPACGILPDPDHVKSVDGMHMAIQGRWQTECIDEGDLSHITRKIQSWRSYYEFQSDRFTKKQETFSDSGCEDLAHVQEYIGHFDIPKKVHKYHFRFARKTEVQNTPFGKRQNEIAPEGKKDNPHVMLEDDALIFGIVRKRGHYKAFHDGNEYLRL